MVLLGLNYLMDTHTTVHLKHNRMWSTLHRNFTHDELVNWSNFHLVYLGQGIYAELIKRPTPLEDVSEHSDVTSLVIGTLTTEED